jgi:hypothetical protein
MPVRVLMKNNALSGSELYRLKVKDIHNEITRTSLLPTTFSVFDLSTFFTKQKLNGITSDINSN